MKNKVQIVFLVFCSFLCLWSCAEVNSKSPIDYIKWVENPENGLLVTKETDHLKFRLQYKPAEYLAIKELKKREVTQSELLEKVAALHDMQYFTFQLGLIDGSDILKSNIEQSGDYSKNIEYLSFYMQQDLKLVQGQDTLPCLLHHFERAYGISPFTTIVLAFKENKDSQSDKTLIYNGYYFGTGIINFTIRNTDLNRIPKIKTK